MSSPAAAAPTAATPATSGRLVGFLALAAVVLAAIALIGAAVIGGGPPPMTLPSGGPGEAGGGLGVSVDDVSTVYAADRLGAYTFHPDVLADGRPRVVGDSADHRGRIELVGDPADLASVSLTVPAADADQLVGFVGLWAPDASGFVTAAIARASGESETQAAGPVSVTVRVRTGGDATVTIARRT